MFVYGKGSLNQSILSRTKDESRAIVYRKILQGPGFGDDFVGAFYESIPKKWYCGNRNYEKPIRNLDSWFFIDDAYFHCS
ncbi:16088_t:CDS:2 [Dentiscutata erythropus]|uniref:16088_t:CDS:1 n=1 Tax=Dentiscutata erythropus TaxID=1348616 RepID=A0A9N9B3J2_9GLOM|nr:16088_t:CDS:2 [Dentiscutata erythropus]